MTRFNTQPPEGGWAVVATRAAWGDLFQHTAARRRLGYFCSRVRYGLQFQHTAARRRLGQDVRSNPMCSIGFNTQPPEGGWLQHINA